MQRKISHNDFIWKVRGPFQRFFHRQASSGILLLIFTISAMVLANSQIGNSYLNFWDTDVILGLNFHSNPIDSKEVIWTEHLLFWINDGLMAIFFFVIGLEIKREIKAGELTNLKKASLPIFAAIGGMVFPAVLFTILANPTEQSGWGIPMATDIAFSLGILSLIGKKVPHALKVFLVTFAIVDDLGAVMVIALFYTSQLDLDALLIAIGLIGILTSFNLMKLRSIPPYILIGLVIWFLFHKAGIHPTIAGVIVAFCIPTNRELNAKAFHDAMNRKLTTFRLAKDDKVVLNKYQLKALDKMDRLTKRVASPSQNLENSLHLLTMFIIMPIFALANAGIIVNSIADIAEPLSLKILLSLFFGKVIGISLFCFMAVKLKLAYLPKNSKWIHIIGLGFLGGIGFTMSIFIGNLAFGTILLNKAKLGILVGSLLSGLTGFIILKLSFRKQKEEQLAA